jgi:hypothetical protein
MRTLAEPFRVLPLILAGLLAIGASGRAEARQLELPDKAEDALDDRWDTWSVAPLATEATSCAPEAAGALSLDVDSDGLEDIVLAVLTPDGVRLVALLRRLRGYDLYDVDALGEIEADGHLVVMPRGTAYRNPRTSLDDYVANDTVGVHRCDQEQVELYLWYGFRFEKIIPAPR